MSDLPVVVIGAGPQGLAAAAHLVERGDVPLVLEAGDGPGAAVAEWAHVRLFSAWPELVDPAAVRLLGPTGWTAPGEGYPTGGEWVERYLAPLAAVLGDRVRYGVRVTGLSRRGRDRLVSAGRDGSAVHGAPGRPRRRGVADRGPGGDRRLRYVAAAQPGGRRRSAGSGGAGGSRGRSAQLSAADPRPGGRLRRPARRGGGQRSLGPDRRQRPGRRGPDRAGHPGDLGAAPGAGRGHLRWRRRGRAAAARCPRAAGPAGGRGRPGAAGDRLPDRGGRADRRRRGAGRRGRPPARPGRRGGGADRLPAGPVVPVRDAAGPGSGAAGAASAGPRDRPEPALLRQRQPARRGRAGPAGAWSVSGRDEVLRAGTDVPGHDRLRAGAQCRRRADRRPRGRGAGRADPARHGGLRRQRTVRRPRRVVGGRLLRARPVGESTRAPQLVTIGSLLGRP